MLNVPNMRSVTFVFVVSVLCSATAITLPNGFTFDESQYLNLKSRATSLIDRQCEFTYTGCGDDCETQLECDKDYNVIYSSPCDYLPYCVKGSTTCSGTFPMYNPTCFNKAINNFMCTADGNFPDPTDCAKYHVCNGSSHSIVECPASHTYSIDPMIREEQYYNPGNGEFACHFQMDLGACLCDHFICNGNSNTFQFGYNDRFHYAYCLELGPVKKVLMFKCPAGTAHNFQVDAVTNSVICLPVKATVL